MHEVFALFAQVYKWKLDIGAAYDCMCPRMTPLDFHGYLLISIRLKELIAVRETCIWGADLLKRR